MSLELAGLVILLIGLPIAIMVASLVFSATSQYGRKNCHVVLIDEVETPLVMAEHAKRFDIRAERVWGNSVPGYSASIPIRHLETLRADKRVDRVEEPEE